MKNQFFGDIRDYRKYGLLRRLSGGKENSSAICWMLTPDVGGPNGKHTNYLRQCEKWRHFDKDLFDALRKAVDDDKDRRVGRAGTAAVLDPEVFSFHTEILKDDIDQRRDYFMRFLSLTEGRDLVFFDPDNGFEINGVRPGTRGASKHLYFEELSLAFDKGPSIVVFQFFRQVNPEHVITKRALEIFSRLDVKEIVTFKTPSVIFFLIPQPRHVDEMKERCEQVRQAWPGELCAVWHKRPDGNGQWQPRSV